MTIPYEIHSAVVDQIRSWRREGARISSIVNRLLPAEDRLDVSAHLRIAFCTDSLPSLLLFPKEGDGRLRPEPIDRRFEPMVEEARSKWESAPPYPDLYRRRDRHAFRAVAERLRTRILVSAVDRRAAPFIGKPGYRPCPAELWGWPRSTAPNAGLIAADPEDPDLRARMSQERPGISFEQYLAELRASGFVVSESGSGYVVRDKAEHAFYPSYLLQGLYSETGDDLWRERDGDAIRCELNLRMGEDLIQFGPWDLWDQSTQSGGRSCRRLPILIFEPDGNVAVAMTDAELDRYYRSRGLPFSFPDEEVS